MSILSYLSLSRRPKAQVEIDQMQPFSTLRDNFSAASRSAFRAASTSGQMVTELGINTLAREDFARDPELVARYSNIDAWKIDTTIESTLPRYKDRDELRSLLADQGFGFSDKIEIPEDGLSLARAKVYQMNLEAHEADELIMANARPGLSSFAAQLAGGLVGSIADPINFIPFAGGLNRARQLTKGTRALSRAGARVLGKSALIGAGEGVVSAAVTDAITFPLSNRWGAGLGWEDAAVDVAFGGALGAGFSALGTAFGPRKMAALHQDAMVKAVADMEAGRPVDVAPIVEPAIRAAEEQGAQIVPAPQKFVTAETRSLLEQRMVEVGRTAEQAAADAEIAIRQHTFLSKIGGADPNAVLRDRIRFTQDMDATPGLESYHQDMSGGRRPSTPEENVSRGLEAMNKVITEQADALDVMYRPEVGGISFYWGQPGTEAKQYADGNGVSHIIARRNLEGNDGEAVAKKLPETLAYGEIGEPYTVKGDTRRNVTKDGFTAVLSLYHFGDRQTWLLTGWGKKVTSSAQGNLLDNSQGYTPQHEGRHIEAAEATKPVDAPGSVNAPGDTQTRPSGIQDALGATAEENIAPLGADGKPLFQAQTAGAGPARGRLDILPDNIYQIVFGEAADASTAVHEFQHLFVEEARRILAMHPSQIADTRAFSALQDGMKSAEAWAGVQGGQWTREAHERLATAFEDYLARGDAPTPELMSLFERMKEWLLDIYKSFRDLGADIPTDLRNFFDRQLVLDGERIFAEHLRRSPGPIAAPGPAVARAEFTGAGPAAGRETAIIIEGQPKEVARYEAREAADLIPSHKPGAIFARREDYPANVQERPYHSDQGEQDKVRRHAQNLEPDFLITDNPDATNGPPIITESGVVLGGNSRVMSLELAYGQNGGGFYREALLQKAAQFGLDPAAIEGMASPVLVRVVPGEMAAEEMAVRSRLYNQTPTQALQAKAEGVSRARLISPETLDLLAGDFSEFDSLREFLASGRSRQFIEALEHDGVLELTQISRLKDAQSKLLNEEGKTLVENALRGLVVPDYDLLRVSAPAILNKLDRAVPTLAKLKARGEGWDVSGEVAAALRQLAQADQAKMSVPDFLAQREMFGLNQEKDRPSVQILALTFDGATQREIQARFEFLAREAEFAPKDQGILFGHAEWTPDESFRRAFLEPLAVVDGRYFPRFQPETNPLHAALQYAHDNSGQGRTVSAAMRGLDVTDPAQAELARTLAPYSGQVNIYEPQPSRFMTPPDGRLLPQDSEPRLTSFEKAGPDGVELDARAMDEEMAGLAGAQSPEARAAARDAEIDMLAAEVEELYSKGHISEEGMIELDAATKYVEQAKRERVGLTEAARCVVENLGGMF